MFFSKQTSVISVDKKNKLLTKLTFEHVQKLSIH